MAMSWMKTREEREAEEAATRAREDQDGLEIKARKEVEEKVKKIDTIESTLNSHGEKLKVLDRMSSFLDEQEAAKAEARKAEATERAKRATETINEDFLTDPAQATKNLINPLVVEQLNTKSLLMRRDIFEDASNFEFYTGEFRKEVDNNIDSLPPAARVDPASIKNCYWVVLGKRQQEIKEGKLKSKFASASNTDGRGSSKESERVPKTLSDEQKRAASRLGVSEENYAKQMENLAYV